MNFVSVHCCSKWADYIYTHTHMITGCPLSDETTVTVIVQDENDNAPQFERTSYSAGKLLRIAVPVQCCFKLIYCFIALTYP